MMFATLPLSLVTLLLAVVPVSRAAQFDVTVGGPGKLAFDPEFVNAAPGDVVIFTFKQVNHTVSQSTFADPCSMSQGGFDTGFVPVGDDATDASFPQAQITVQDSNPVWAFCRQADHCQKGMVFAINPADKFDAFKSNAMGLAASSASATADSSSPTSTVISTQVVTSVALVTPTAPVFSDPIVTDTPLSPIFTTTLSPTNTASTTTSLSASILSFITPSGFATATRPPSSSTTNSIPTSIAVDHFVIVGGKSGQLTFTPSNITASPGDTITFEFHQTNHSVTASSFSAPCTPLSQTLVGSPNAFDSGFKFVKEGETTFPTWELQVKDTEPMWAFCAQARHCADHGMVFSVNADKEGTKSFDVFQRNAMANASKGSGQSSAARLSARSMSLSGMAILVVAVASMLAA